MPFDLETLFSLQF